MKLTHYKRKHHTDDKSYSDVVMTPKELAHRIVDHLSPSGKVLEPCRGDAPHSYYSHPSFTDWCEVREDKNFFDFEGHVDWTITNPPFSIFSQFLEACLVVSDNVVLGPVHTTHLIASKKRMRMMKAYGFGIKEIIIFDTPIKPWPQTGFQYCAYHLEKGWKGVITFTDWTTQ